MGQSAIMLRGGAHLAITAVAVALAFGRILTGHAATDELLGAGVASGLIAWATERRGMFVATTASGARTLPIRLGRRSLVPECRALGPDRSLLQVDDLDIGPLQLPTYKLASATRSAMPASPSPRSVSASI
jgi:hypothetical protein